ncbi:hypothetical protein PHMEG_00016547 [Phytophthora megakarya]|uniref:PHD-type domain-containing protein n=1 Tax=Phytophthora megakarya TaxID=4795 RepID=A0A225VZN0_9STRA|nr:hypothetical protein PHMEG_00016547 [Phytophthora megakarya]
MTNADRAEIPAVLSQEQRDAVVYTPQCQQRWGERQGATPLKAEDIEEFLKEFAWLKETEMALQCLFDANFDVPKAVKQLHAARRAKYKARRDQDKRLPPEEFKSAVSIHGKKFHRVKQQLGKVVTREVVSKYYLWKRTDDFKEWWRLQKIKKTRKSKKETERLRQWADDSDPETEPCSGYHNTQCELCATGGKLLCCDGCARAYHFSCVQPPITKIPGKHEDWYCVHCQQAFGGPRPKLLPSDDNEFCMACPLLPGVPRSRCESITDASSFEEDDSEDEDAGASSESNDNSDQEDKASDSAEALNAARNGGSFTDNEPDSTSSRAQSSSPADDNKRRKVEQKNVQVTHSHVANQQTNRAEIHSAGIDQSQLASRALGHPIETNVMGIRRNPPVQLERPGSGRKRHRKTLVPRRIPRFDS